MAPWMFDVKFPRGTQFTFGSLTFATGEDGDLEICYLRTNTRAPGSDFIINIRLFLLKFVFLCRDLHPHRQDRSGYPDHDIHPPTPGRGIEFIFIGIDL
jgi:hypothetical protein